MPGKMYLSTGLRRWSFNVLRLTPVARTMSAMVTRPCWRTVYNLEVQLGQGGNHYPLALQLGRQPALLLLQGP